MRRFVLAAVAAVVFLPALSAASASVGQTFLHNGNMDCSLAPWECSRMTSGSDSMGNYFIHYSVPRPGLARMGIGPGQLLVSGKFYGNGQFMGKALRFNMYGNMRCDASYDVAGGFDLIGNFRLSGPAPIFDEFVCATHGNSWAESQSYLLFVRAQLGSPGADLRGDGFVKKSAAR